MMKIRHLTAAASPMLVTLAAGLAAAQPAEDTLSAQQAAPVDMTGHWVALITDDWIYRMMTPARGDHAFVPLNAAGRRVADAWDAARDAAAGEECKGYAAPIIMRLPSRVHITWEDENTLRLDIDTGMQTRLFHFDPDALQGPKSWQGFSAADWEFAGVKGPRSGFYRPGGSSTDAGRLGSLRVETNNLRAGYLQRNGVPYSEDAEMTEYFNLITEDDGSEYLVIQTFVKDPRYLARHHVRTMQFRREPNGANRNPLDCTAADALFQSVEATPQADG